MYHSTWTWTQVTVINSLDFKKYFWTREMKRFPDFLKLCSTPCGGKMTKIVNTEPSTSFIVSERFSGELKTVHGPLMTSRNTICWNIDFRVQNRSKVTEADEIRNWFVNIGPFVTKLSSSFTLGKYSQIQAGRLQTV